MALGLDPVTTPVDVWAEPFHKTTHLTENDCLGKDLENTHFSSETEGSTDTHMRACQPAPPSSPCGLYKYGGSMLLRPETRPINQEQLVIAVKGICAGLVMVERKCIDIYRTQFRHKPITSKREQELLPLCSTYFRCLRCLRYLRSLQHWLHCIDNCYERVLDPLPLINERCFSAGCPCWRFSSIPVRYPHSLLALGYRCTSGLQPRRDWIGTQLSTAIFCVYVQEEHNLAVYVLYLEAYD